MKKLLAIALAMSASSALFAAGNMELLKQVPSNAGIVAGADIAKIIAMPSIKDARARDPELEKQFQELESKLAAKHLTIPDMVSNFVVFSDESNQFAGILASTKLGEGNLEALLKGEIFSNPPSEYSVETIAGRKTYVLKGAKPSSLIPGQKAIPGALPGGAQLDSLMNQGDSKPVALTFLDKDTLLIASMASYEKALTAPKGLGPAALARLKNVNCDAPIWGVASLPKRVQGVSNAPNAFVDKVSGLAFCLEPKGQAQDAIGVRLSLECQDPAASAFVATQIQQMMFAMTIASGRNPDSPVADILNALALSNKDQFVVLDLTLSKKLMEKLAAMQQRRAPREAPMANPGETLAK